MAERTYSPIPEGQEIVEKLVEAYPEVLWQVRVAQVTVLGIDNKEPTKRSPKYRIRSVKNAEKAVLQLNKVDTRYIIETYWSEWNVWDTPKKEWVIFKALLQVGLDDGKILKPDCSEFRLILDKVGVDWEDSTALPLLTVGDPMEFDLDLRPGLEEAEETEED